MGFVTACAAAMALLAPTALATEKCGGNEQFICFARKGPNGKIDYCDAGLVPTSKLVGSSATGVCVRPQFKDCGNPGQLLCKTKTRAFCHRNSDPTSPIPDYGICSLAERTSKCGNAGEVLCTKFDKTDAPCNDGFEPTTLDTTIGVCADPAAAQFVRKNLKEFFGTSECGNLEQLICSSPPPGVPACANKLVPTTRLSGDTALAGHCVKAKFLDCGSPGQLPCERCSGIFCHGGAALTSKDPATAVCKSSQVTSKCGGPGQALCGDSCDPPLVPSNKDHTKAVCVYKATLAGLKAMQY